jgi:Tol biopolymer transport system component
LFVALVLINAAGVGVFGATLPPPADRVCSLTQITDTVAPAISFQPAINAAGTRIVFRSTADLTGETPDNQGEIFLFHTLTDTFTQVTTGGERAFPPNLTIGINAAGTRIAFSSHADLTGENPDGNGEIFLFHTRTDTFTQVTHTESPAGNFNLAMNAAGTRIAFLSTADLTGENPDGNNEIFLFHTRTSTFTQVTHTTGNPRISPPVLSGIGTRIAFSSHADLTGENPDGNVELFLFDTLTSSLTQVTHTVAPPLDPATNFAPTLNAAGTRIAFVSFADLTGENPDRNQEIFLFHTLTNTFIQVTHTTGSAFFSGVPALNASGTRIAFVSNANLTGENPDGNEELVLFHTTTNTFTQVARTTGSAFFSGVALNALGTRIAFLSNADLTGGNADGNFELFLATCEAHGNKGEERSDLQPE